MGQLADAVERYNTIKHEHITERQREVSGRDTDGSDLATLTRCLNGTGVDAGEALAQGRRMLTVVQRDLRRAGKLSGANRRDLDAIIFATWIDGLAVGLHTRTEATE